VYYYNDSDVILKTLQINAQVHTAVEKIQRPFKDFQGS